MATAGHIETRLGRDPYMLRKTHTVMRTRIRMPWTCGGQQWRQQGQQQRRQPRREQHNQQRGSGSSGTSKGGKGGGGSGGRRSREAEVAHAQAGTAAAEESISRGAAAAVKANAGEILVVGVRFVRFTPSFVAMCPELSLTKTRYPNKSHKY